MMNLLKWQDFKYIGFDNLYNTICCSDVVLETEMEMKSFIFTDFKNILLLP